ncbi:MAG: hypothetical protein ACE37K_04050 [Planctomycetota bacterium]
MPINPQISFFSLLALASCAWTPLATAQSPSPELITNGTFDAGFAGWNPQGFAGNPTIETFDTTGLGASPCFAADPNVAFVGFSGFTIEQDVPVVAGRRYAFAVDTSYAAPASSVADTGLLTVQVDSAILIQKAYGQLAAGQLARDALCATFVATQTGVANIKFTLHKLIFPFVPVARMRVDNFSVRRMHGPVVGVRGDRRPGDTATLEVHGESGDGFATFAATQRAAVPVPFAGLSGALELESPTPFGSGVLPNDGVHRSQLLIPAIPALAGLPVELQAVRIPTASPNGGFGPARSLGVQN